ncbi:hypothetical protein [Desulfosporosinus meridiei]|uniref:Uncharacterized protein n=1 Tax=Desulfosporosinus meridiei (strain ATCC BAA-275 / DSM 13257 / KCTC 12902 / NCIMB 13706 / S10) TaxID=768704 RepID=J7IUU9_DESMD|nr:hypothetical protein [Desulfosporosinus meridiei]AFQ43924.1 hypothetical protein Desmer_1976 [Desulfosporosinus meridiei DSM 13257]
MIKPTLEDIIEKLELVDEGKLSREEISNWAERTSQFFESEGTLSEKDISIWKSLDVVMGIDIKDSPEEYLHNEIDIRNWITRFRAILRDSEKG